MLAPLKILAISAHLLLLTFHNKLEVESTATGGLHCNFESLSSQNCTTGMFCTCPRGISGCHRLDLVCVAAEHDDDLDVCLKPGYCITYENETASMGLCQYYPKHIGQRDYCFVPLKVYQRLPLNLTELTSYFCEKYNREGPMCSKCKSGYGPAVYAYSLMCVKCKNDQLGWLLYAFLVLFPITLFYVFIIVLNIRATHPLLLSVIFTSQVFCSSERSYLILSSVYEQHTHTRWLHQLVKVLCGIWNLDFFRDVIPPFCLSSHLSNTHAIYLESLYIVYPPTLIVMTYICIELHANNFKPIILMWKPFHKFFSRLRRVCDPKGSIINAFSSFFLLTSSRTISTAIHSLHTIVIYKITAHHNHTVEHRVLYADPDAPRTLPLLIYGNTLIILVLVPTILLCAYPIKCIRNTIEYLLPVKSRNALKVFMDTFHGHCKDGTNGTQDFRAVSGLHTLVLLAVNSLQIFWVTELDSLPAIPLLCFATSFFIASARPYKKIIVNLVVSFMFGLNGLYLTIIAHTFAEHKAEHATSLIVCLLICMLVPHLVLIGYIIYKLVVRSTWYNTFYPLFEAIRSKIQANTFNPTYRST